MEAEEPEPEAKKIFAAGDAVTSRNYMVEWADLRELVRAITVEGQWLLMTGPWQSGKSSLMFALAQSAMRTGSGYFSIVTTIGADTINSTNEAPTDSAALTTLFDAVCEDLALNSSGKLKAPPPGAGLKGFRAMLVLPDRNMKLLWFIDEASELVRIRRSVLDAFLKELRLCKQQSASRQTAGVFCLHSFVLVGTPVLSQLVEDCRIRRMAESETYVPSSPLHDVLGKSKSPLSAEASRKADFLSTQDVQGMLEEYCGDYRIRFTSTAGAAAKDILWKLSGDTIALTGGHKGMVGSCCEFIHRNAIFKLEDWKRAVRLGHVSRYLFYSKVYGRALDNMAVYPERAKQVIVECIHSASGSTFVTDADALMLLPAVNDGILLLDKERAELSSGLLLSAMLEDCLLTPLEALPDVDSFVAAVEVAISYMKPDRFLRDEVLNANGQPSEYIMQSEFLLGMKLVLEHKYTILVEAKKRNKNGQRRCRLDFLLKNAGSPPKGFEVQCLGSQKSIEDHLRRSEGYRALHGCEMHYIYFVVGACDAAANIKAAIQAQRAKYTLIHCWFVGFLPETSTWNMEQLLEGGDWKNCTRKSPACFPKLMLQSRRNVLP